MTKQQDFSMWSANFILFCLANFLYYGAFYLYIPVLPQYVEMLACRHRTGWRCFRPVIVYYQAVSG